MRSSSALLLAASCSLSAALVAANPAANPAPTPIHFPLTRRSTTTSKTRTREDIRKAADFMRLKYNYAPMSDAGKARKRGNTANIQTTNSDGDASYFATINVGTP